MEGNRVKASELALCAVQLAAFATSIAVAFVVWNLTRNSHATAWAAVSVVTLALTACALVIFNARLVRGE